MVITSAIEVIKTIASISKELNAGSIKVNIDNTKKKSISSLAKNAILEYPVITSRSLDIKEVTMISKALERQYASYVRLAMSLDDTKEADESKDDYIKRFHTRNPELNSLSSNLRSLKEDSVLLKEREIKKLSEQAPIGRNMTISEAKEGFESSLIDNDVKKSNELVPTLLEVTINNKNIERRDTILLGIKAILHPVSSEEMVYNVSNSLREKRNLFRFIQFSTGEIKFARDYILAVDSMRNEALNKRSSFMWRTLRLRSNFSRVSRFIGGKENLLPNSTLVLSMDEVEAMSAMYNMDLLNDIKLVEQLMNVYFLLGIVIVDSSSEVAHFFFDGHNDFQTYSFSALERENSNPQRDLKNMLSLLGR